jgi:hypothetical protein
MLKIIKTGEDLVVVAYYSVKWKQDLRWSLFVPCLETMATPYSKYESWDRPIDQENSIYIVLKKFNTHKCYLFRFMRERGLAIKCQKVCVVNAARVFNSLVISTCC